jgi:hypothetical protein
VKDILDRLFGGVDGGHKLISYVTRGMRSPAFRGGLREAVDNFYGFRRQPSSHFIRLRQTWAWRLQQMRQQIYSDHFGFEAWTATIQPLFCSPM